MLRPNSRPPDCAFEINSLDKTIVYISATINPRPYPIKLEIWIDDNVYRLFVLSVTATAQMKNYFIIELLLPFCSWTRGLHTFFLSPLIARRSYRRILLIPPLLAECINIFAAYLFNIAWSLSPNCCLKSTLPWHIVIPNAVRIPYLIFFPIFITSIYINSFDYLMLSPGTQAKAKR